MSVDTPPAINQAETIAEHIKLGKQAAMLLQDMAEQLRPHATALSGHADQAGALGLIGAAAARWTDIAGMLNGAVTTLDGTADAALAAAEAEEAELAPLLEAASQAAGVVDGSVPLSSVREA